MKILRCLFCAYLVVLLSGCAALQSAQDPPRLAVTSFEIGDSDGLSQAFIIGLKLTNPNSSNLQLQGLSYSLALNGYELVHGVNGHIPIIAAYSETTIKLTAQTNLFNALRFINNYLKSTPNDNLKYELAAKLDFGGLLGKVTVKESGVVGVGDI